MLLLTMSFSFTVPLSYIASTSTILITVSTTYIGYNTPVYTVSVTASGGFRHLPFSKTLGLSQLVQLF